MCARRGRAVGCVALMGKLGPMKGSSHLGEGYLGSFGGYSDGSSNRGGGRGPPVQCHNDDEDYNDYHYYKEPKFSTKAQCRCFNPSFSLVSLLSTPHPHPTPYPSSLAPISLATGDTCHFHNGKKLTPAVQQLVFNNNVNSLLTINTEENNIQKLQSTAVNPV